MSTDLKLWDIWLPSTYDHGGQNALFNNSTLHVAAQNGYSTRTKFKSNMCARNDTHTKSQRFPSEPKTRFIFHCQMTTDM